MERQHGWPECPRVQPKTIQIWSIHLGIQREIKVFALYMTVFSISVTNQKRQDAKFFGPWRVVSSRIWKVSDFHYPRTLINQSGKLTAPAVVGAPIPMLCEAKCALSKPQTHRRALKLLVKDARVKIAPISELEEWLWGTLSICLKKVVFNGSDSIYAGVSLRYGEFGCLTEGVCFGLFNSYFQKIGVANSGLKKTSALFRWVWGLNLPNHCRWIHCFTNKKMLGRKQPTTWNQLPGSEKVLTFWKYC